MSFTGYPLAVGSALPPFIGSAFPPPHFHFGFNGTRPKGHPTGRRISSTK